MPKETYQYQMDPGSTDTDDNFTQADSRKGSDNKQDLQQRMWMVQADFLQSALLQRSVATSNAGRGAGSGNEKDGRPEGGGIMVRKRRNDKEERKTLDFNCIWGECQSEAHKSLQIWMLPKLHGKITYNFREKALGSGCMQRNNVFFIQTLSGGGLKFS